MTTAGTITGMSDRDQHQHPQDPAVLMTREYWEDRYRSAPAVWSGNPNPRLVEQVATITPGDVLDVGSGEGADAIWLASGGWHVTGLDISSVALDRAAERARKAGPEIARRIVWQQADLVSWEPGQQYDLVSAQFMHLPRPILQAVHRKLAAAVRDGGLLLIVGHHPADMHSSGMSPEMFYTAAEVAAELDPETWEIRVSAAPIRQAPGPDGELVTIRDAVLMAQRRG